MTPVPQLQQALRREWDRCADEGEPLTILLVALDQASADAEVIRHLERAIHVHCARERDKIVPQSAGVFVAMLPRTTPPGAHHVGEQIVEAMRHTPQPTTTAAVGVAGMVPSVNEIPATLLHRAERILRAAQDQGGDRCLGASTPRPPRRGAIAQLRKLLQKPKKNEARQRHTD
jgi:PleD family two-component response regulator